MKTKLIIAVFIIDAFILGVLVGTPIGRIEAYNKVNQSMGIMFQK